MALALPDIDRLLGSELARDGRPFCPAHEPLGRVAAKVGSSPKRPSISAAPCRLPVSPRDVHRIRVDQPVAPLVGRHPGPNIFDQV